jgi:hypothetical protein
MLKTALAQLVAAKFFATAALAAAATGGIALAAATNSLPTPLQHAAHNAFGAPNVHASGHAVIPTLPAAATHRSSGAAGTDSSSDAGTSSSDAPSASAPSPSLVGLCHAYEAGVSTSNGKALDNPAFTVLITAAGGRDNVAAYCATVLPSDTPSANGSPTTHPDHPTGGPTALPSQAHGQPTSLPAHSTGKPSDLPSHPSGPPTSVPARH